jgi:signal transduction histidine kinase
MPEAGLSSWLRSSHVRFVGLILLLQLLFGGALLISVTQLVRADLDSADSAIAIDARDTLLAVSRSQGDTALKAAIADQVSAQADTVVLLAARDGRRLAGNLPGWPASLQTGERWNKVMLDPLGEEQAGTFAVAASTLSDGRRLLVGQRTGQSDEIRRMLKSAMLTALMMALPLTLFGAWLAAHIIDRRVAHIVATVAGVGAGDIARRVPLDGSGDSFDKLGHVINAMLDRIGSLLAELRMVTDSIAHDLRSPLTRLRARIDRAMLSENPAALRDAVEGVGREADELLAMLSTALEISRMEAGIGRDRFTPVDLGAMLEDIGDLYAPLVEERGAALTLDIRDSVTVAVHRELMGQALSNLIDNALKYGAGGITLMLWTEEQFHIVAVADQGPGIPAGREQEALRRFGRLDAARGTPGAGLGLSLVGAVADMHGGSVRLARLPEGFAVELLLPKDL